MTVKVGNVNIPFKQNNMFNGAFKYLQTLSGTENICQNIVKVSASSTQTGRTELPIIRTDYNTDYYWTTQSEKISWYEVDFINNTFYLESYVIRDHAKDFHSTWKILGSNDGIKYDVVDEVTNFQRPSGTFPSLSFKCKYPKARRIFRFYKDQARFYNDFILVFHRLEFFGRFVESRPNLCSRKQNKCTRDTSFIHQAKLILWQ